MQDKNFLKKIVQAAKNEKKVALEIGPGSGNLTSYLDREYSKVIAIEKDRDLIPILEQRIPGLELFEMDFLDFPDSHLPEKIEQLGKISLFSNIPYKYTSSFLTLFCRYFFLFSEAVIMIQKEVAEKLLSKRANLSISAKVQAAAEVKKICDVPGSAFYPPPRVESTILYLEWKEWLKHDWNAFETFIDQLFLHKRKQLGGMLRKIYPDSPTQSLLKKASLKESDRAHQLTPDQLVALFHYL